MIVMSSSDSAEDQALAHASGASAYFRKPAYLEQFMEIGGLVRSLICAGAHAAWGVEGFPVEELSVLTGVEWMGCE